MLTDELMTDELMTDGHWLTNSTSEPLAQVS